MVYEKKASQWLVNILHQLKGSDDIFSLFYFNFANKLNSQLWVETW